MEVFFYGLFMDETILVKNGVTPTNPRTGYLQDYTLKIGNRASLVPCKNEKSYGLIMTVDKEAVLGLYSEASVADYIPEEVNVTTHVGDTVTATCYNLPCEAMTGTNRSYANALYFLAKQLNFPEEYVDKIKSYCIPKAN